MENNNQIHGRFPDLETYMRHELATALAGSESVFSFLEGQSFPNAKDVQKIQGHVVEKIKRLVRELDKISANKREAPLL